MGKRRQGGEGDGSVADATSSRPLLLRLQVVICKLSCLVKYVSYLTARSFGHDTPEGSIISLSSTLVDSTKAKSMQVAIFDTPAK